MTVNAQPGGQADTVEARRKRRPYRREQLMRAAIHLFHERGFHATSMDDIGEAAGITGPAVYRHFVSKQEILETALLERVEQSVAEVAQIVAGEESDEEELHRLVDQFVDAMMLDPELTAVSISEQRSLSRAVRSRVGRAERLYIEEWVHVLSQLRPELTDGDARALVHGAMGVAVTGVQYQSGLDRERLGELTRRMMLAALLA